ncbi:MAG: endo-1,4-beta-xylanase [Oscillospiraceae bacterium]|nr:endo-1,4-beta-xylanase [Oscillospiraceae bacterium]
MQINNKYTHRTGTAKVHIPDSAGKNVNVKMTRHKMLFGCAEFGTIPYLNGEMDEKSAAQAEKRMKHMTEILNSVTLPFYWGRYEPVEGKPDTERTLKAAKWLHNERGMTVKGHPLCWHTVCAPWLMEYSNAEIMKKQLERITRDVGGFKGAIDMWDVINEAVIMPLFDRYDNAITRICKERGRINLIRDLFKQAREANPEAILLINDFETSESYDILVEGLLEAGIKIDVIGIQSHMHQGYWGVEKTHRILERFSRFNLPIHFTENTIVSGRIMPRGIEDLNDFQPDEWPSTPDGLIRQAEETVLHYETLFAHPLIESITWWSFTDGGWLKAPGGLLDMNNDPKPVYNELHKRIKGEWWTPEQTLTADENGFVTVSGFKGDYAAVCNGNETKFSIS